MGSKGVACTGALFLCLNLLMFSMVSAITPVPAPVPVSPSPPPNCSPDIYLCLAALSGLLPPTRCCSLIAGIVDLELSVCLCFAIKANVLGIPIVLPIDLKLDLNRCGRQNVTSHCAIN